MAVNLLITWRLFRLTYLFVVQSAADFTTFRCQQAVNRERKRERMSVRWFFVLGGGLREREYARDNNLVFITLSFNRWAGTQIDLYLNSSISFIFRIIRFYKYLQNISDGTEITSFRSVNFRRRHNAKSLIHQHY